MSRKEFIQGLKNLVETVEKGGQPHIYIYISFDDDISGVEGHQILKDVCDSGIAGIIFRRDENRKERHAKFHDDDLCRKWRPW